MFGSTNTVEYKRQFPSMTDMPFAERHVDAPQPWRLPDMVEVVPVHRHAHVCIEVGNIPRWAFNHKVSAQRGEPIAVVFDLPLRPGTSKVNASKDG